MLTFGDLFLDPRIAKKSKDTCTTKSHRSPHIRPADGNLHDYNGVLRWSVAAIQGRCVQYCRQFNVDESDIPRPREHTEGKGHWIYPIMESVVAGIENRDRACIELGVEFIEEEEHFVFGRILKSNTARALRRAQLSPVQTGRLRERIVKMLLSGDVPHEYQQYAKLLRHMGLGSWWPIIEHGVKRDNPYVMRYYEYLRTNASVEGKTAKS